MALAFIHDGSDTLLMLLVLYIFIPIRYKHSRYLHALEPLYLLELGLCLLLVSSCLA